MRIAVTGRDGQVATALAEYGAAHGVEVVRVGRPALDLAAPESVRAALAAVRPDVVVNAAAFTAVDLAESQAQAAFAINAAGAGAVAEAARALEAPVIQLSTDYVFDGEKPAPYHEDDATGPVSVYGASKLAGERAVAAATEDHVILRTAWVYAASGKNFVRTMLRLAQERDAVRVVADQRGCPSYAPDIAAAVIAVARNLAAHPRDAALRGVFHLTGQGEATWAQLAEEVFAQARAAGGKGAAVIPITTAEYPTPARRPRNSRLDGAKLARVHGVVLPEWRQSLARCVARIYDTERQGEPGA
ncbi:MAG: dTDP-4-dehydrorhamnose reductase [Pseudochelatococcus sp.]|jgi:dTDP-4-dehydrorhamnose reductase|uniref:dTDP-4-dehydrorhamnose reductase n=1 Tax=Pseudochelatococcus sp. TaxID=2020869 RepID=UPI003D906232